MLTGLIVGIIFVGLFFFYIIRQKTKIVIPEDYNAVVVDQEGFIKMVLPSGIHHLRPGLEKIEFLFETKTKLAQGTVADIPTCDGILLNIHWSATYTCNADLITSKMSQKLRNLPNAEKGVQRQVDLALRSLIGTYELQTLFKPEIRQRVERLLQQTIRANLKASGVELGGVNLQEIKLPNEVTQAFNQAKAIATLDAAIKASDLTTREMVTGAHKMETLLEWEKLLPPYGRYMLTNEAINHHAPA